MTDPEISSGDISPPEPAKEDEKTEVVHSKEAGKRSRRVTAQQADDRRKATPGHLNLFHSCLTYVP